MKENQSANHKMLSKYGKISYAQQGEDLVLNRILYRMLKYSKDYIGTYIDCGAYHPVKDSITYFLYEKGWKGICLDISESTIKEFRIQRPQDKSIWTGAGDQDGEMTGYFLPNKISVMNTCDKDTAEKIRNSGKEVLEKIVPVTRLSTVIDNSDLEFRAVDFLNIDVEGFEMSVLRGIDMSMHKPKIIALEIHSKDVNAALKTEVARYIVEKGYKCVASCVITFFFVRDN